MSTIPLTSTKHNPSLGFTFAPQISILFFHSKLFFSQKLFPRSLALSLSMFVKMSVRPNFVGTKGVSQNHLLSFDDNKVLKLSIGYAKNLFKCTGS